MPATTARVELVQALNRSQSVVRAYAYVILRDFHLAEDAAQEVALLAAERWDALPRGEAFLAWAKEAARRKALELRRKAFASKRRDREFAAQFSEETLIALEPHFRASDPDGAPGGNLGNVLKGCLEMLQPHTHEAIRARYGENHTCEEIAVRLGRSIQSVYSLLKRARLALAECVDRRVAALDRK